MEMSKYQSITRIAKLPEILEGTVEITEKIDGSNIRIGLSDSMFNGFTVGSKEENGIENKLDRFKTFKIAIDTAKKIYEDGKWRQLGSTIMLVGEYLSKRSHGNLTYSRIPKNNIYLFSVSIYNEETCKWNIIKDVDNVADMLELEKPNTLFIGKINKIEELEQFMNIESCLGDATAEGIVIKNYSMINTKHMVPYPQGCKLVRKEFEEKSQKKPSEKKEFTERLIDDVKNIYLTPSRINKNIDKLVEAGLLDKEDMSKKDIGLVLQKVYNDLEDEESDEIKEMVYKAFIKQFRRKTTTYVLETSNLI